MKKRYEMWWSSRAEAPARRLLSRCRPAIQAGITTSSEERTLGAISLHFGCADNTSSATPLQPLRYGSAGVTVHSARLVEVR